MTEVLRIRVSQYVNHTVALDLVRAAMSGCRLCLMEVLAGFHFLVPRCYANHILAHDLVETVLIGYKFS